MGVPFVLFWIPLFQRWNANFDAVTGFVCASSLRSSMFVECHRSSNIINLIRSRYQWQQSIVSLTQAGLMRSGIASWITSSEPLSFLASTCLPSPFRGQYLSREARSILHKTRVKVSNFYPRCRCQDSNMICTSLSSWRKSTVRKEEKLGDAFFI